MMEETARTKRVVLGLGGTVDYELTWDSAVLERLVRDYRIGAHELSTLAEVSSERDLVRSLLAFVRAGSGGEHFIDSSDIVDTFAAHFPTKIALGGTCVRAALAMDKLGLPSTLHLVSIDDYVRRLLPPRCSYICSATEDSTNPHLIVQFPRGARVRAGDIDLEAPQANRVIYVNDPPNRHLALSDRLGAVLGEADIFLVSGLNVFQDRGELVARLHTLRECLRHLPSGALVFYEDAAFHVPALSPLVPDVLGDAIDVHSLNEDELQAYLGRPLDLLDANQMQAALTELRAMIKAPAVVVHTRYWGIVLGHHPETYAEALRGGITMAATRYAYGGDFTETDYRRVRESLPVAAAAEFAALIEERMGGDACCIPAFAVESQVPTTVGLGDSFVGGFLAALAAEVDGTLPLAASSAYGAA